MKTPTADVDKKLAEKLLGEVPATAMRKHIHVLPSGRKLKIVADNETELKRVLFVLQS